jgi:thymidylate synthase ThyX
MKKIEAKIVADSINPQGDRITTFLLTFPRFILAELNTHRVFSKNSASSRAIPFHKMVKMVETDPFIPIAWQKEHKGMQGSEYITDDKLINRCKEVWLHAKDNAVERACELHGDNWIEPENEHLLLDVTKQICNRLLEPFMWHTVLLTGTEFKNFFELRCPKYIFGEATHKPKIWKSKKDAIKDFPHWETHNDLFWRTMNYSQAEIHMQALAEAMWDAYNESTPKELKEGEWHIPFGDQMDEDKIETLLHGPYRASYVRKEGDVQQAKIEIATARCARLSYMTFDGEIDYEKDLKLYDTLLKSHHMSPFEHCARAMSDEEYFTFRKGDISLTRSPIGTSFYLDNDYTSGWCRNFKGFIQYRHLIENNYEQ